MQFSICHLLFVKQKLNLDFLTLLWYEMYLSTSHDSMYPRPLWLSLRSQSASKHIKQIICNYWRTLGMFLQMLRWKSVATRSMSITTYSLTLSPCESKSIWSDAHFSFFFLTSALPCLLFTLPCLDFIHLKLIKINQAEQFHMGRNAFFSWLYETRLSLFPGLFAFLHVTFLILFLLGPSTL